MPPAFMRGVPEGRGESEYLRRKYSEKATFRGKVAISSVPAAPGFARIPRATSPIYGGGRILMAYKMDLPDGRSIAFALAH